MQNINHALFLCLLVLFVIVFVISTLFAIFVTIDRIIMRFANNFCGTQKLRDDWLENRAQRRLWRIKNPFRDFHSQEYQELWEKEIGSEIIYLMQLGYLEDGESWREYKKEGSDHEEDSRSGDWKK
jgi:ABC-type multidrug transport system fused ATPase/permease subunit